MAYSCLANVKFARMCSGAGNDYQKDKQFKKLNAQKDKLEVKVIRDGEQILVENTEVVVGDLLLLDTGDKIVADGIVAKSFHLVVDEAALTGESEPLPKGEDDMWCMSGSEVTAYLQVHRVSILYFAVTTPTLATLTLNSRWQCMPWSEGCKSLVSPCQHASCGQRLQPSWVASHCCASHDIQPRQ